MAQKWNSKTEMYEPYVLPEGATLSEDLDQVITCASCGRRIIAGYTYTSRLIHNELGLGYAVCPDCYEKESGNSKNISKITKYKLQLDINYSDEIQAKNKREAIEEFICKYFSDRDCYSCEEVYDRLEDLIKIEEVENE